MGMNFMEILLGGMELILISFFSFMGRMRLYPRNYLFFS